MAAAPVPAPAGAVAIVAGAGRLPLLVAAALERAGRPCRILALRGFADPATRRRADATVDLLDVQGALARLEGWAPAGVTLAGAVARPSPAALLNTLAAFRNREALRALASGGDDRLLRGVLALLEEHGLTVLGVHDLAPGLMAPPGLFGRHAPDEAARVSVATGRALLASLSPHDVGQAAVVGSRRVLAVEGPEGTDRMLARARAIARRPLGLGRPPAGLVLVKLAKAGQDLRVDLPAIGPRTVRRAAAAGCAGLAVEAGATLVLDRPETAALADRLGLFLLGLEIPR
ncbi:UDP-2,3-diacylglucosamine pyrophosphatase LpxI [Methylobacterium crusticola]|uniref:UDP-2,3-diacylglucosamine pyrophosphatase LpxI n=1 Tax=Methylobacterium crusticola TaxID=1697972 RepID=A0ABQ4R3H2_9HYPH|nr:UDP-2,3-diacylglucosamine diphosphatase LpxI [Methylobacterium crusticola]GJD51699.1 UDP-2,3-diacylglucosamine pyrophosphatase LpxI [Methylobacterium crusticola]